MLFRFYTVFLFCFSVLYSCNESANNSLELEMEGLVLLDTGLVDETKVFGNELVATFSFEEKWRYANWGEEVYLLDSVNEHVFVQLCNENNLFGYDTILINRKYSENNDFVSYYIPFEHVFDSTMQGQAEYFAEAEFEHNKMDLVFYKSSKFKPEQRSSEFAYRYSRTDLISYDKEGGQIDGIPVAFSAGRSVFNYDRFFFMDSIGIIHVIDFFSDEEYREVVRIEKWKMLDNGFFVRQFDRTNGMYSSYSETGEVVNNTKNGKWIEIKSRQINKVNFNSLTYVEANYKNGVRDGVWSYYDLVFTYARNSDGVLETVEGGEKKGDLIFTETYNNGKCVNRDFHKVY